jgi:hypothetical protein
MLMFKAPDVFRAGVSGAPGHRLDLVRYALHGALPWASPQDNSAGYAASSVLGYASRPDKDHYC